MAKITMMGLIWWAGAQSPAGESELPLLEDTFVRGEVLNYRVHYGFINAGEASIKVAPGLHEIEGRTCYKMEVLGRSTGTFDLFMRIRDTWGAYVDTTRLLPRRAYRHIEEGKYRKREITYFNHDERFARVVDERKQREKTVNTSASVYEMVSGAFYLRAIDYSRLRPDDVIRMQGVLEDELFDMEIIYRGRTEIRTDEYGKMRVIHLVPVIPNNKLFDGENAIEFFLSDDGNRVPVKVRANMYVGAVEIDLKSYGGLRHPFGGAQ